MAKKIQFKLPELTVAPYGNYMSYTGKESKEYAPTWEQYKGYKQNEARINAVRNMQATTSPVVPVVPRGASLGFLTEEQRKALFGTTEGRYTCIATATDQYGDGHKCSLNTKFYNNPEQYGFKRIDYFDLFQAKTGDLFQFFIDGVPKHMYMVTGTNTDKKQWLMSGSSGGHDSNAIVHNKIFQDDTITPFQDNYALYRFVGNKKDQRDWLNEYKSTYR